MSTFQSILNQFRKESFSQKDKGERFRTPDAVVFTPEPYYAIVYKVWLWNEFPFREDLGGNDTGIDLVAKTTHGAYGQFNANAIRKMPSSQTCGGQFPDYSRSFVCGRQLANQKIEHCLWISTTNHWGSNAEEAIRNHTPAVSRISLFHLQNSSVDWINCCRECMANSRVNPAKPL
jgi:predicted helicase